VLVNDEAGPDGSQLTTEEVKGLVSICYGKGDSQYRQAAFDKLCGLPLVKLYRARPHLPSDLAMHIARVRCSALGASQAGVGSGYMPADWAMFVSGKEESAEMMRAAGQDVPESPPPRENQGVIDAETPLFADKFVSMGDIETKFAGMKFSGSEPLK
jgi:hypothetical protein